jgi:hypothetical protein
MKRIIGIVVVALGLVALQQATSAQNGYKKVKGSLVEAFNPRKTTGRGKFTIQHTWNAPNDPDSHQTKSGPLSYALAPTPDYTAVKFGVLDVGIGKFHPISTLPTIGIGIARDEDSRLYSLDLSGDLYQINPGNGKAVKVGATEIAAGGSVFAATADGTLYAMDPQNNLYLVNAETGIASLVGATGISGYDPTGFFATSFAGDCRYLYYILGVYDNYPHWARLPILWRINPQTAAAELVGPVEPPLPFFGAGFIDNRLFGFSFDETSRPGGQGPKAYQIDVTTGVASFVSDLNVASIYGAVPLGEDKAKHCPAGDK